MKIETDDNPVTPPEQGAVQALFEIQKVIDAATSGIDYSNRH